MEVVSIHAAARSGAELVSHQEIEAVAGKGLVGDRYFDGYSKGQITVVSEDELSKAEAELGLPIEPGATRRNVTVKGLELPRDVGARLRLGEVVVEVYRDAAPCNLMNDAIGPGARDALRGRSGIRGLIIRGGRLRVGDPVEILS